MSQLINTLTGTLKYPKTPGLTGNTDYDLKTQEAAYHPGETAKFQAVMMNVSQQAYKDRQKTEMEQMGTQFDPTKVSGGTFHDIIGYAEKNRGQDISKIYGATMQGHLQSQQEIKENVFNLRAEKKNKEDELRQLKYQFPDADIKDTDSENTIALKIKKSNERKVVIDLYTQTFGSFPTGMSVYDMNKKLAKKYKNYDKKKQKLEMASMEGEGSVKQAEDRDAFIADQAKLVYAGNKDREAAKAAIDSKYPGYGNEIFNLVQDNYVSNKKDTGGGIF